MSKFKDMVVERLSYIEKKLVEKFSYKQMSDIEMNKAATLATFMHHITEENEVIKKRLDSAHDFINNQAEALRKEIQENKVAREIFNLNFQTLETENKALQEKLQNLEKFVMEHSFDFGGALDEHEGWLQHMADMIEVRDDIFRVNFDAIHKALDLEVEHVPARKEGFVLRKKKGK